MRNLVLAVALFTVSTNLAAAESANGNWGCRTPEGANSGVLTIQSPSFGFAAPTPGSAVSGLGTVTAYQDGVTFDSGPLHDALGIKMGRLILRTGALALQLETDTAIALTCAPI